MKAAAVLAMLLTLTVEAGQPVRVSWYGARHHGRLTASGERFDRWGFTCASRTLKFGTWLHLRNPKTGRWVFVRVTDRGPYIAGRDLDLSEMAARQLGIERAGVAQLDMTIVGVGR